jgi:hypothetical protein
MTPTVEELAYAVLCLSGEGPSIEEIPHEVIERLIALDVIRVVVGSAPALTTNGLKTYRKMIAGGDVPEFIYDEPTDV